MEADGGRPLLLTSSSHESQKQQQTLGFISLCWTILMSQGPTLVAVISSGLDVGLSQQVWGKPIIGSGDIGVHQGS